MGLEFFIREGTPTTRTCTKQDKKTKRKKMKKDLSYKTIQHAGVSLSTHICRNTSRCPHINSQRRGGANSQEHSRLSGTRTGAFRIERDIEKHEWRETKTIKDKEIKGREIE